MGYFGTITVWRCEKFGIRLLGRVSASPYQCPAMQRGVHVQPRIGRIFKFSKVAVKIKLWDFVHTILTEHSALSNTVRYVAENYLGSKNRKCSISTKPKPEKISKIWLAKTV